MKVHHLKIKQVFFLAKLQGVKPFEIRKNDRDFQIGDMLVLHKLDDYEKETGRTITQVINYVFEESEYLQKGYVIISGEMIGMQLSKD